MGSHPTRCTWVLARSMTAAAFLEIRKHGLPVGGVWAECSLPEQLLPCAGCPAILPQGSDASAGSKRLECSQNTTPGQCFPCQIPCHGSLSPNIECFALAVLKKVLLTFASAPGASPPGRRLIYLPLLVPKCLGPGFKVSFTPVQGGDGPATKRWPWGKARLVFPSPCRFEDSAHQTQVELESGGLLSLARPAACW